MPWSETCPMNERTRFLALEAEGRYSMSELCARFSISRKTGYKWRARGELDGLASIAEHSRKPRSGSHRTAADGEQLLVAARQQQPTWGPRKWLDYQEPRHPAVVFRPLPRPARS